MRIKEKGGRTEIRGENALKKSRKKGKTNKINKKKGKIQSGVAYDPLLTKRKTFSFGRFTKQNKKNLQVKSPLEGKIIYIINLSQSMENNSTISTPPCLHFPKITFTSFALLFKTQKRKSPHTFTPFKSNSPNI
jgi:hypothetical protein